MFYWLGKYPALSLSFIFFYFILFLLVVFCYLDFKSNDDQPAQLTIATFFLSPKKGEIVDVASDQRVDGWMNRCVSWPVGDRRKCWFNGKRAEWPQGGLFVSDLLHLSTVLATHWVSDKRATAQSFSSNPATTIFTHLNGFCGNKSCTLPNLPKQNKIWCILACWVNYVSYLTCCTFLRKKEEEKVCMCV